MTTRAERIAIVQELRRKEPGASTKTPPSNSPRATHRPYRPPSPNITPEQAQARRQRIVQVLQLRAGLPVTEFEKRPSGRPRGKAQPMDISHLEAEWRRNMNRVRGYTMPGNIPPPWGQILSPPWRPRW